MKQTMIFENPNYETPKQNFYDTRRETEMNEWNYDDQFIKAKYINIY